MGGLAGSAHPPAGVTPSCSAPARREGNGGDRKSLRNAGSTLLRSQVAARLLRRNPAAPGSALTILPWREPTLSGLSHR